MDKFPLKNVSKGLENARDICYTWHKSCGNVYAERRCCLVDCKLHLMCSFRHAQFVLLE